MLSCIACVVPPPKVQSSMTGWWKSFFISIIAPKSISLPYNAVRTVTGPHDVVHLVFPWWKEFYGKCLLCAAFACCHRWRIHMKFVSNGNGRFERVSFSIVDEILIFCSRCYSMPSCSVVIFQISLLLPPLQPEIYHCLEIPSFLAISLGKSPASFILMILPRSVSLPWW